MTYGRSLVAFPCFLLPLLVGGAGGCIAANALPGASAVPVRATSASLPSPGGTCAQRARQPLNATWKVETDGKTRSFVVHVPQSYDPSKPTPLVFNFHGFTMSPKLEDWLTKMAAKSDEAGFLLVYPQGTGTETSFNGGTCCGDASSDGVDDVAFTRRMLDRLEADLCVDARRVYATGMSNGGFMSHRLACEMSDRIAAVAPVSGVNASVACNPTRAVPVLDFHGTADPTVPFEGDQARGWLSVPATIDDWARRDGCKGGGVETLARGDVRCTTYGQCRDQAEVTLCTVEGGGHTWPGGTAPPWIAGAGKTTTDVVADDLIWSFFQKHPMPAR
jgi:polyhydroxybutyrate depolymerase